MDLPMFTVHESTVTHENPKVITDGLRLYHEAHIEIDATKMTSGFLHMLMYHMGEGNIRVKIAKPKEQA